MPPLVRRRLVPERDHVGGLPKPPADLMGGCRWGWDIMGYHGINWASMSCRGAQSIPTADFKASLTGRKLKESLRGRPRISAANGAISNPCERRPSRAAKRLRLARITVLTSLSPPRRGLRTSFIACTACRFARCVHRSEDVHIAASERCKLRSVGLVITRRSREAVPQHRNTRRAREL